MKEIEYWKGEGFVFEARFPAEYDLWINPKTMQKLRRYVDGRDWLSSLTTGEYAPVQELCSLEWTYSRNQRRHTAFDSAGDEVFWVVSEAPPWSVQGTHGYLLKYPYGAAIKAGKTVAELKRVAAEIGKTDKQKEKVKR